MLPVAIHIQDPLALVRMADSERGTTLVCLLVPVIVVGAAIAHQADDTAVQ